MLFSTIQVYALFAGWNELDSSIGVVVQGFGNDTAAVAAAIGQGTVVREEEPLTTKLDNGRMGGL